MRIIVTGGGTGGHIYPALAIAQKIKQENPDSNILYVGTPNSMESDLVPKQGFEFESVYARYLERKVSFENVKTGFITLKAINDAKKIIKRFKPDVVIGTGGYVCGPVVYAAHLCKIPTMIHEQNVFPGITNKLLSRVVDKIAISFDEARKYFKYPEKITLVGNPVREEILRADRTKARSKMNIADDEIFIYSFGGSGGQKSLNDAVINSLNLFGNRKDIKLLHVTGKRLDSRFKEDVKTNNMIIPDNVEVIDYCYNAAEALAASDIVIASGGAISITEITKLGKASIIIPKTYTAENHQEYNARALEKAGAAIVILEKDLENKEILFSSICKISDNQLFMKEMADKSKEIGNFDAENGLYKLVLELNK